MPQISRIRIINFSYNNNNRHIVDEVFNFYQGENALLNLKNGGGKSVLVQLLLQPIIPKAKLMGRRIEDFFKGKKTPTYVLIEWKLEDQGGYLLTGIGLANRESQVREQDETNNSLKYFIFTSNYHESNLFDIVNIPLIKNQGGKIYIEDFKEARKIISSKEKDLDFRVKLFTDEDRLEYSKHLASYNISQDEWRSIVLKINESEGGVIEIFGRCKTSQQLMNDWILKTVEKVVNKEDKDQKKLEQMLENLVEEMINNEQFIYEKEIYEEFLKESNEYLDKLNSLVKSLGDEESLENQIAKMYYYLKSEINKMEEEINNQNEKISCSERELKKIDLEERSKEYYDQLEKVNALTELYDEENTKFKLVQEKVELNEKSVLVQQAAREYGHIKELRRLLSSIKEEIDKIKNSSENKEKIRNLEYSLKIAYEKALGQLNNKEVDGNNRINEMTDTLNEYEKRIRELDDKNSKQQNKIGRVESEITRFEEDEKIIKKELELKYDRNLLGEIEKEFIDEHSLFLEEKLMSLNEEKENIQSEIDNSKINTLQITEEISKLRDDGNNRIVELTKLRANIENYNSIEESIKPVFEKYNIDFKRRFNHEENQIFINNKINELQGIERDLDLNVRTIGENITSLKNGTLHVSKEFREFLINKDIAFETGENYLRKQSVKIRSDLLKNNPILPFAYLLYDDDIELLKNIDFGVNIHQIIPILSYSDINQIYIVDGNLVKFADKLQFMCLYDNKMIDADNLNSYLDELDNELDATKEQLIHYWGEIESAREDIESLKKFSFDKNYIYNLESEKGKVQKDIKSFEDKIKELENEQKEISTKKDEYISRIHEIEILLSKTKKDINKFSEFVMANEEYLQNKQLYESYLNSIREIGKEKIEINENKKSLTEEREELLKQNAKVSVELNNIQKKHQLYKDAEEGDIVDDDVENMEARLQTLKREITSSLERLEHDNSSKQGELKEKQKALKSYNIEESQYIDIVYDSEKLENFQYKLKELKEEEKKVDKKCREVEGDLREAKGKLESAEKEVKKLAESPIEPALIKLNFDGRRKEGKENISRGKGEINNLRKVSEDYVKITNKIEGQIDISKHEINISYSINNSIHEDYKKLFHEYIDMKQENKACKDNAHAQYQKIRANYENKNINIENIFTGLDSLIEEAQRDENKYYYLGERILHSNELLNNLIRICQQRLSNVEKNKNDMIQHSYLQAKQVYDEIQKIAENSSIKLEGKSRPMPMLRIDMVPLEETEEENRMKMNGYIENCVSIIKRDMKEDKKIEEIHAKISKYMSTKELLNVISDLGKMSIYAYKIDINVRNSRYKTWEQVMKENSGGERFVSFFAVLVALMSYTRTNIKFEDDYQRNNDTKVLIMDNPFGPISSEHLLKPLFKIAGKYNTQLICLTDLKQNSILNCFNLIYMIKIRENSFGTNEYVQLEQQIKDDTIVEKDEMLEKAVFKAADIEQISMVLDRCKNLTYYNKK